MCSLRKDIPEQEVKHELNEMEINKYPGNDDLTKEFDEAFWDNVKVSRKSEISTSEKQAVIKLIEKRTATKSLQNIWNYIFT